MAAILALVVGDGSRSARSEQPFPYAREAQVIGDTIYLGASMLGGGRIKAAGQVLGIIAAVPLGYNEYNEAKTKAEDSEAVQKTQFDMAKRAMHPMSSSLRSIARTLEAPVDTAAKAIDCSGVHRRNFDITNGQLPSNVGPCINQFSLPQIRNYQRPGPSLGSARAEPKVAEDRNFRRPSAAINTPLGTPCLGYGNRAQPTTCQDGSYTVPVPGRVRGGGGGGGGCGGAPCWENLRGQ